MGYERACWPPKTQRVFAYRARGRDEGATLGHIANPCKNYNGVTARL